MWIKSIRIHLAAESTCTVHVYTVTAVIAVYKSIHVHMYVGGYLWPLHLICMCCIGCVLYYQYVQLYGDIIGFLVV